MGVHIQETLRPIHLQGVARQGERDYEARIKYVYLVQPGGEQKPGKPGNNGITPHP